MLPWTDGRLGFEFNWGEKNWLGFTSVPDPFIMNKLAVRGKVYEVFYRQPFWEDHLQVGCGVQFYDYDYSGSGVPVGEARKLDAQNFLGFLFPQPKREELFYLNINLKW